jgi:phage/conjugal plasmid C-4 type zinc finger TraR family protein
MRVRSAGGFYDSQHSHGRVLAHWRRKVLTLVLEPGYGLILQESELGMATGWAGDGAVQEQIDATIKDAIERARGRLPQGVSRSHCEECDAPIPKARRKAMPGVRLCVPCQQAQEREAAGPSPYNRRGSKDSQLR